MTTWNHASYARISHTSSAGMCPTQLYVLHAKWNLNMLIHMRIKIIPNKDDGLSEDEEWALNDDDSTEEDKVIPCENDTSFTSGLVRPMRRMYTGPDQAALKELLKVSDVNHPACTSSSSSPSMRGALASGDMQECRRPASPCRTTATGVAACPELRTWCWMATPSPTAALVHGSRRRPSSTEAPVPAAAPVGAGDHRDDEPAMATVSSSFALFGSWKMS
jgi:hypothetical protein